MAPTKIDICNMALGFIGTRMIQASELTSSPPNSPEAVQCLLYWDRARRAVLTDFVCEFSVRRNALSTSSATSATSSNWAGKYTYPANALKILSVHSGTDDEREPFEVDYVSDTQCVILTDATSPQCVYVVDVEDLTQWNETFVNAMALKLAILISTALLKNNPEKIKELASLYQAAMPRGMWGEGGWAVNEVNTKLGVMNMALGLVGARMITSVTENVPEAVQCNLYWDRARRSVLRDFPYRFAVRHIEPSTATMPPVYGGEWTNCYAAPADMLKVLSVCTTVDKQARQPFAVEYLSTGAVILCNVASAQATYIADVTDPALWDEKFTAAMAAKLALFVCGPLLSGEKDAGLNKAKELGELYKASIPQEPEWELGGWAASGETERLNVCNIALGYLGVKMITHLGEDVPESVQCRLNWDRARRSVLRDYPFRFAVHRGTLSSTTKPSAYGGTWSNAYAYPADALRVISLHDGSESEERLPFAVEYTANGPVLLCNKASGVQAVYIADVESTALWDEQFTTCMGLRLAMLISGALLPPEAHQAKMKELLELYQRSLPGERMKEENWAVEADQTKLDICNTALSFVGANMIASVSENCPEAVQCNLHWERARRAVLRDYPYRFSIHREALTPTDLPDVYGGEWSEAYSWPEDALRVLSVHDADDKEARQPFAVEYMTDGTVILCNVEDAEVSLIADVEDPELWDEKFISAMARRLALEIAPALLPPDKLQGKMQELTQLYQMALPGLPMVEENWAVEQNSTRLNICNMALGYVEARTISSISENIPEAIQCSLHWDNARRSTLRDFPYRFAQQRFQLEEVALPALYQRKSLFGAGTFWALVYGNSLIKAGGGGLQWSHCYKVPECLKIVRVHDGRDRVHRIPFAIELVDGSPCIFTNIARAQATCTIDIEDVDQWDELFVQAMARKLAILIYPALRKERGNGPSRS